MSDEVCAVAGAAQVALAVLLVMRNQCFFVPCTSGLTMGRLHGSYVR